MFRFLVALAFGFCISTADENIKIRNSKIDKIFSLVKKQSERMKHLENTINFKNIDIIKLQNEIFILKHNKNESISNNWSDSSITKFTQKEHSTDEIKYSERERRFMGESQSSNQATAFYAYMGAHLSGAGRGHMLIFDRVVTNENSCYRPETGIFVAKTKGIYVFTISIRLDCGSQSAYEIVRNAVVVGVVNGEIHNTCIQTHLAGTVVPVLNAGDEVHVRTHSQLLRQGDIVSDVNGWTSFAGWLTSTNVA